MDQRILSAILSQSTETEDDKKKKKKKLPPKPKADTNLVETNELTGSIGADGKPVFTENWQMTGKTGYNRKKQ